MTRVSLRPPPYVCEKVFKSGEAFKSDVIAVIDRVEVQLEEHQALELVASLRDFFEQASGVRAHVVWGVLAWGPESIFIVSLDQEYPLSSSMMVQLEQVVTEVLPGAEIEWYRRPA
jgi:hypothetical protein